MIMTKCANGQQIISQIRSTPTKKTDRSYSDFRPVLRQSVYIKNSSKRTKQARYDNFFDHLVDMKKENINILNGMTDDPEGECARYEEKIASYGGIDLFMGGIGVDGHLAFNEPYTSLTSRTGVRDLTTDTRIVNSRFFGNDPEAVPAQALSVGIGTVTDSKEVLVLISGHNKARAMAAVVEGGVSQKWTCSALQMHNGAIIACDEEACGELTVDTYKYFLDIEKKERL